MVKVEPIHIIANGQSFQITAKTLLPAFLSSLSFSPEQVVVEHNKVALTREECKSKIMQNGDVLEIVRIVAGG